ncbi:hypothetical protein RHMOL_Rhmol13G0165900 [Rhododendron molle]|uniref:Uncharacterized protein n=1 Tax=Rhododendron molle TaxID=49168 RepID=A0ACC0L7J2_RHOML|nr:hypothetical protein RHMOL_Rhmol13G0165900 [Rhododendron molle]
MVRRVLVDQGSSTEILYHSTFKALDFTKDHLSLWRPLWSASLGLQSIRSAR